jgi:glycosyltransferase involved in cell wall biosynthesis
MNVLLVTESYWPNADGGAFFERRLVHGLIGRGHTVTVWAPGPRFASFDEQDGPSLIHRERGVTLWANTKYKVSLLPIIKAREIILRDRPEVIHIHNCYWMGLSAMFWARRMHIPVIATNHFMPENLTLNLKLPDIFNQPLERATWSFLVWFHNRANYVTSPTPTAVKLLRDHGLKVDSEPITNGIDISVFRPGQDASTVVAKYNVAADRPVILYVGRLDGEKRLDLLVSAMAEVKQAGVSAQLVLVGYGKAMGTLKSQAERLGIGTDVVFTGFIDETDKPLIYNAATVFAISSPAELQSIVTLEAMASGLPVVAVDVAALKELCHDGENGYLFPKDDFSVLAQKITIILKERALQKRFGAESISIVQASHSTEYMFEAYEAAYKRTMIKAGKTL